MKTKISKKVISIYLTLLICISALPLSMLSANAASYDITIRNVVYPRPDAVPQADFTFDGNLSYELYGWVWQGADDTATMGPENFVNFYSKLFNTNGEYYYELENFIDTEKYNLTLMFVVRNTTISYDSECNVSFYDENGNLTETRYGSFIPVETLKSMASTAGTTVPEDLSDNDTIMMCSTSSKMCCPEDHTHIQGQYSYDDNGHWRECLECGQKIIGSDSKHSDYCEKTENWVCVTQPTASKDGEYVKKCPTCSYVTDRITVPKTGEQTVVTTYEELRNALAKGGKQWITLDFPNKSCVQQDFNSNYTLCVDDPNADITIDLNNCTLERTAMYDDHLFEIKQGSLRLWQKDGNGIDTTDYTKYNIHFHPGANSYYTTVFYVEKSGSLRLTNVHVLPSYNNAYSYTTVKSYGNLRIDSGIYKNYEDTPTVCVIEGTAVINGGYFESSNEEYGCAVEFLSNTTAEINYGHFGAIDTAVRMGKNTVATINGGTFDYKETGKGIYQECALRAEESDLTINGGNFYASTIALRAIDLNSLNISNGYFNLYSQTTDKQTAALYLFGDYSSDATISSGSFKGIKGIYCSQQLDFSKIIRSGCYVVDNDTGLVINHKITDKSLGGSIRIDAIKPRITTQPSGGHSPYMGDTIVLKIEAENANEYIWHIIDEDGNELSWNYLSNNGYATPATSEGGKKLFLYGVSDWMTGKRVYCEVKGDGGTVMSDIVTLSVDKVVKYCHDMYFDDFDEIWNHKTVGDYKAVKTDTNAPYTITEVRWQLFNKVLSDDFEFTSGDTIALLIGLAPKEGYELYVASGSINGINSSDTFHMTDGRQYLQFEINITAPDEYKTQNIELTVAEPVAGQTPATTAICTSGHAIPGTPSWTPSDTTFKSGEQYTVKIPVKAEYEWGDISTVTAKVNGKDAKFIAEYKGGKQYAYYVEYTFDATKDYLIGDVNGDGNISVLDATLIQKYIAGLVTFSDTQIAAADVNNDGSVSVLDATQIQKFISGMIDNF